MTCSRLMLLFIVSGVLLALTAPAGAALIPHLEWVRTYDSPAHGPDRGWGVAVDALGNAFVNGHETREDLGQGRDIWLRKYDTNGNTLWTETYDNPSHSDDSGRGVVVGPDGNIYALGAERRHDLGQDVNAWLRKYDTNGNALWTQAYDSPAHGYDQGWGVAVDTAGNVYVTGYERRDDLDQAANLWLRKYDTNGNTLWTQTYDNPAHSDDSGHSVVVDSWGNVYVAGSSDSDIWLRKYDTNGNTLWTETYASPVHEVVVAWDVAVDSEGSVYVTGVETRDDLGQGRNIWLRKYDMDGNTIWTETYDGIAHGRDDGRGVTTDMAGNIYVAGFENRDDIGQGFNIWLRKYDTNGNTLWTETYDSPAHSNDMGLGVAVDSAGNVYVTGFEGDNDEDGLGGDIILLKYSQVPEPGTLLLLAPALLGVAGFVLRKRSQRSAARSQKYLRNL